MVTDNPNPIVPLRGRYASKEMRNLFPKTQSDYRYDCSAEMRSIFSDEAKYLGWRHVWVAFADAQKSLGLNITDDQMNAMRQQERVINFDSAAAYEKKLKHDVMAYLTEFKDRLGEVHEPARRVPHRGMTSCSVTCNEEISAIKAGLEVTLRKTKELREQIGGHNLDPAIEELEYRIGTLKARGAKGTTGTQASFLELFDGDHTKVKTLDKLVAEKLGFPASYTITGQTYPRIVDAQVLGSLTVLAGCLSTLTERPANLYRELLDKSRQAAHMASNQWLERSLDDSSERRIIIPESFYLIDRTLDLVRELRPSAEMFQQQIEGNEKAAIDIITAKTASSIVKMHKFAKTHRDSVATGYTHGQFAQPITYGKRIDLWAYNFVLALKDLESLQDRKGSPFALDLLVNSRLTPVAVAAAKMATDIRLLQHDLEVSEPFGISQIGSTAMAFKKNPMKDERVNGLARNKIGRAYFGLDDYDFLNTDAVMELVLSIFSGDSDKQKGFTVYPGKARANLMQHMPFLASENLLMEAVKAGGDREILHERIRLASLAARREMDEGRENNMLELMARDGFNVDLSHPEIYLNPETHVGRSREQVDEFGQIEVQPIAERYASTLGIEGNVQV